MKLNNKDKKFLTVCGYYPQDLKTIEILNHDIKIYDPSGIKRIRRIDYIKKYGRLKFLSSAARACFHYSACGFGNFLFIRRF